MNLFEALRPWTEVIFEQVPGIELFDAHTHLGFNDPDGMKQSGEELVSSLQTAGARGAFTFPFHEPDGYRDANDAVIEAARQSIPTTIRSPRPSARWMPAPGGSSYTRARSTSRSITPG
jgi:hypothetical protein